MVFMSNVDTKTFEFSHEQLDLLLGRIPTHVAKILVGRTAQDFVDHSRQTIGDSNFGFVRRAQA